MTQFNRFGIMGMGAWGTALAIAIHRAGSEVRIWGRRPDIASTLSGGQGNEVYLPDIAIPALQADTDVSILGDVDAVLAVVPAQHMRDTLAAVASTLPPGIPVLLCAKGIERQSLKLMTHVLRETLPDAIPAVLSGPSFAHDVAQGLPTAITLASSDEDLGHALIHAIGQPAFRPYWTSDLIGAEIGGAVKNVLAIACGIVEGMELGRSAHAALLSRGFAEMRRLALVLGAQETTLSGLSGLGDLVLTCSSSQSRNMSFGIELGRGRSAAHILAERMTVTEGAATAPAITALAEANGVEMPICNSITAILAGDVTVQQAIASLLERPFKGEN